MLCAPDIAWPGKSHPSTGGGRQEICTVARISIFAPSIGGDSAGFGKDLDLLMALAPGISPRCPQVLSTFSPMRRHVHDHLYHRQRVDECG